LTEVSDDFLDLGRIVDISLSGVSAGVDLPGIIRECLDSQTGIFQEKSLNITFDIQEDIPQIRADASMLRKTILALLDNAVKFTPDQGVITVSVVPVDDIRRLPDSSPISVSGEDVPLTVEASDGVPGVRVCVADSGTGIESMYLERIFEPFFQVQGGTTDKTPGTGLGLSLVMRFAAINQGTARAYSSGQGQGACICFTLPSVEENRKS
jgi:signal transduction histidine kinase